MALCCRAIKTNLQSILRVPDPKTSPEESALEPISKAVLDTNRIVRRGWLLLKLCLIHPDYEPPLVDRAFVLAVFRAVTTKRTKRGKKVKNKEGREFLDKLYSENFPSAPPLYRDHLQETLLYAADEVVVAFENNIKQNYTRYVEKYVKARWKARLVEAGRNGREIRKILEGLSADLMHKETPKSPREYHQWISSGRSFVVPDKKTFARGSVRYDVHVHPQHYFPAMLRITNWLERQDAKLPNVCPLRTSVLPKYITLDTRALLQIYSHQRSGDKTKLTRDNVWDSVFKTELKAFRRPPKGYEFHRMIKTDGVSCSIIHSKGEARQKWKKGRKRKKEADVAEEKYIDELPPEETERLRAKKVVGIDPNMSDLLYCVGENGRRFRYTQNQRRKETSVKRTRWITSVEKAKVDAELREKGEKTIGEREAELSSHNHKTIDFDKFKAYIRAKLVVNGEIETFYHTPILRKLRLNSFWATKRSERKMLERFREIFGHPEEVVVGFGDWEQRQHRKYLEPTKGKGFRRLLRQEGGYEVYLVDEHKTSARCCRCRDPEARCEKRHYYLAPDRRKADRRPVLVHGLLTCTTCERRWNRDVNSAINIGRIVRDTLNGLGRPEYLTRRRNSEATSP